MHVSKESGKRASNFRTFAKVQVLKHFIGVLGKNIYGVKDLFYFQFELKIASLDKGLLVKIGAILREKVQYETRQCLKQRLTPFRINNL